MAQFPPHGDGSPSDPPPERPDLSDAQVEDAFAEMASEYAKESLPGPRDYIAAEEDDRFIPPDPGPVASSDPFLTMGWTLLAGGLAVILGSLVFWPSAPRAFHIGCVAAVLVGGGILTWRMPHHKSDDDDLGAVITRTTTTILGPWCNHRPSTPKLDGVLILPRQ